MLLFNEMGGFQFFRLHLKNHSKDLAHYSKTGLFHHDKHRLVKFTTQCRNKLDSFVLTPWIEVRFTQIQITTLTTCSHTNAISKRENEQDT